MIKKAEIDELIKKNLDRGFDMWVTSAKREHHAISYFDGMKPCLMVSGAWHDTLENLKKEHEDRMRKDIVDGYKQRQIGYYDKWYRYSRWDGGFAYDLGCRLCCDKGDLKTDEFHLIECS